MFIVSADALAPSGAKTSANITMTKAGSRIHMGRARIISDLTQGGNLWPKIDQHTWSKTWYTLVEYWCFGDR